MFFELAHRYGDELLLWDGWGATQAEGPEIDVLADEVAGGCWWLLTPATRRPRPTSLLATLMMIASTRPLR